MNIIRLKFKTDRRGFPITWQDAFLMMLNDVLNIAIIPFSTPDRFGATILSVLFFVIFFVVMRPYFISDSNELPSYLPELTRINVNTASVEELMELDLIGKKRAEAIVAHRTKNGCFHNPQDLDKVKGIGQGTLDANFGIIAYGCPNK